MNSAVWKPCEALMPDSITPVYVDLPGHGENALHESPQTASKLDDYVEYVASKIQRPALVVGWSLGGLVALRLAERYPDKVSRLLLVASSPRFVQASDWTCAVEADVFDQFASMLQKDVAATIRRFLALQVRGTSASMKTVKQLQQALSDRGTPAITTMINGLNILSSSDLRSSLNNIQVPVNWLLGDRDAIVPVELAPVLRDLLPQADIQVLEGAGHAPFISHPEVFVQLIDNLALPYSS